MILFKQPKPVEPMKALYEEKNELKLLSKRAYAVYYIVMYSIKLQIAYNL